MGKIIVNFKNKMKPSIFIKRNVDKHETQELRFIPDGECWLKTETGNNIELFGRDDDGNTIEVLIPISIEELKEALKEL